MTPMGWAKSLQDIQIPRQSLIVLAAQSVGMHQLHCEANHSLSMQPSSLSSWAHKHQAGDKRQRVQ